MKQLYIQIRYPAFSAAAASVLFGLDPAAFANAQEQGLNFGGSGCATKDAVVL